jgi:GxxExxY protein
MRRRRSGIAWRVRLILRLPHRKLQYSLEIRMGFESLSLRFNSRQPRKARKTRKKITHMEIIYKDESYAIMGACFEVYKELGSGFVEPVYQECLEIEFAQRGIPFIAQEELAIKYKSYPLKAKFKPDFRCYEKIILEIKAVSSLIDEHRAQVHNYLNAAGCRLGLLVNFGGYPVVEYERIVY